MERRRRRLLLLSGTSAAPSPVVTLHQSIFDHSQSGMTTLGDAGALTLGVLFRSQVSGMASKISFYKTAADPVNARSVGLYDATSFVLLASGSTTAEPAGAGWITADLTIPVLLDPMKVYVAAVHFPSGQYAAQIGGFTSAVTRGFIEALADADPAAGSGNGRYVSGASLSFPSDNFDKPNYWIDVQVDIPQWVDASNTGVQAGITLTPFSGTLTLSAANTVTENLRITGNVVISAENVTLKNCEIIADGAFHLIRVEDSTLGAKVINCTITGNSQAQNGILGRGSFWRNHITGVENGIALVGASDIRDNYIHSFTYDSADPHYDGIECNGGSNNNVIHNTILLNHDQAAAVMFNNEFAGLSNIVVSHNYITGGSYTLYVDSNKSASNAVVPATILIHDNRMGTGVFGYFALTPGVWVSPTPYNNYDAVTGLPI